MSTRIKAVGLNTREEFDHALGEIAKLDTQLRLLAAKRDKAVQAVQEQHAPGIAQVADQMEALTLQCEKYAGVHRDELLPKDKKTVDTPLAFFGFRLGNNTLKLLNKKWTWDKVVEALEKNPLFKRYVRTTKEVDKDGIKGDVDLDDEKLASVGLRIEQPETFFIEPKAEGAQGVKVS